MSDINEAFKAAGQIRAQQIRDEREAKQDPVKTTRDNGNAFAEHVQALITQRATERDL